MPEPPADYEYVSQCEGSHDIAIRKKAKSEMEKKARPEQIAGLIDLVERYAKGGLTLIPRSKFNTAEGWFPSDKAPGKVRLEAFRPYQLRAYGFCCTYAGRPTFFITGIDPSKKQDRANQNILAAAGAEAFRLSTELEKLK